MRLGLSALKTSGSIESNVEMPNYADADLGVGILHFGLGQFAKGHLLAYTDQLLNQKPDQPVGDWRVVGVSLKSDRAHEQLAPQDYLYSLLSQSAASEEVRVVAALADIISLSNDDANRLRDAMVDPAFRIVSLTITEKGYYQHRGRLDLSHPDIQADLADPLCPVTAIGWLALGLKLRRERGMAPFTVVSLDNIRGNGSVLHRALRDYCEQLDANLAKFISEEVSFPSSMVDRIVPAIDDVGRHLALEKVGLEDAGPVITETFCQWVLEDRFTQGRPEWEQVGVLLCDDIEPFESMKLKLLNGAHTTMAYLGMLAGLETVADCLSFAPMRTYLERLLKYEVLPEVDPPPGILLDRYIEALMLRFSNPHLRHRCAQIALDGSEKLQQRLLPVIEARVTSNKPIDCLALSIAGWIMFLRGFEYGYKYGKFADHEDPRGETLRKLASAESIDQAVRQLINDSGVFSEALNNSERFVQAVIEAAYLIQDRGPRAALESHMGSS